MWLMLQQDKPDDFVLATGHMHSVREFVEVLIIILVIVLIISSILKIWCKSVGEHTVLVLSSLISYIV